MDLPTRAFATIALALAACGPPLPPGTRVVRSEIADETPSYGDGGPPVERPEACNVLRRGSERVLVRAQEHEHLYAAQRDRLAVFGRCLRTTGGAWALVLEEIESVVLDMGATQRLQGRWALVHTDGEGGHRISRSPAMPSVGRDAADDTVNFVAGNPTTMRVHDPVFFDYDGAGEPEVAVVVDEQNESLGTITRGRVWSLRGEAIEPYGPAREITVTAVRDVDGDNRPDLFTHGPYVGEWGDACTRHNTVVAGPALLAHARREGGGFALDDEAAQSAARTACPEVPSPLVAAGDDGAIDNARTAMNVACARIHGVPASRVIAQVRAGCRAGRRATRNGRCVQGCNDVGLLVRWASATPPLRLAAAH